MDIELEILPCAQGENLPLLPLAWQEADFKAHRCRQLDFSGASVGTVFHFGQPLFMIDSFEWKRISPRHLVRLPILTALKEFGAETAICAAMRKDACALAVITLSDKGAQGLRQDASGPEIIYIFKNSMRICLCKNFLIPDDAAIFKALLGDLACNQKYDIICTTGGTGLGPRDITPQITAAMLDFELPGFVQAMMAASLRNTPHAPISRSVAGVMGKSLVINLPGSVKAVSENLQAIMPAIPHALEKLAGDPADCGG